MVGLKYKILAAILILGTMGILSAHADRERVHCMDVNRDGQITIVDAMIVAQVAVGLREAPDCRCKVED